MKMVEFIRMALLAVVLCTNFTACSSGDEPEELQKDDDGLVTNQKKLVEITHPDGSTREFTYDDEGKLIMGTRSDGSTYSYAWNTNTIVENTQLWRETFNIENNLITTTKEVWGTDVRSERTFNYDSNGLLQNIKYKDSDSYPIKWEDGKIIQIENAQFSYSGKACKGYLPILIWHIDESCLLFEAHPELIGMRTNQLPDGYSYTDNYTSEYYDEVIGETCQIQSINECTTKYTYTWDNDGYLESCTSTETDIRTQKYSFKDLNGDGIITNEERDVEEYITTQTYTDTYTFKWE